MIYQARTRLLLSLLLWINSGIFFIQNAQARSILDAPSETITLTQQKNNYTGIVKKLDNVAQQITVKIDNSSNQNSASGVIIAKQDNNYYVLTAKFALCNRSSETDCQVKSKYQIITPDGESHNLEAQNIEIPAANVDMAIVKFTSDTTYSVATLANYQWTKQWVFTSGFIDKNNSERYILTAGKVFPSDEADFVVRDAYSLRDGNELVYTNDGYAGMAGGAVLDSQGRLIGIHTGTEADIDIDDEGNYNQFNIGYSLGIPIKYLLNSLDKISLQTAWLKIENTVASNPSLSEEKTIEQQLQKPTPPNENSDISEYINYGNQLWRYGNYKEANSAFEAALKLDDNYDKVYYAMGLNFLAQGDYQQAATVLEKAVNVQHKNYYYWQRLGQAYKELGEYEKALTAYDCALENFNNSSDNISTYLRQEREEISQKLESVNHQ